MKLFTPKNVLFDLDGTLLDTAPDLAYALNATLIKFNRKPLAEAIIRPTVSHGTRAMLKLGFDINDQDPNYPLLQNELLSFYQLNIAKNTQPFPGIIELLTELKKRNIGWGIVTNKPASLTLPLIAAMSFIEPPACIVSGDTAKKPKPAPDPIYYACDLLNCAPAECIYMGDAIVDVTAAKAAGMPVIIAEYGYIPTEVNPKSWAANAYIQNPIELLDYL